jgi:hypothetical protein
VRLSGKQGGFQREWVLWRNLDSNLLRDGARHLDLQLQVIGQFALVVARPKVRIGWRVKQLDPDLHAVTRSLDRPFEHSIHVQFSRDRRERFVAPATKDQTAVMLLTIE